MIKCGGKQLTKSIHLLLCKVWENEVMPEEWSIAIISPIHKKGNLLDCNNYRGIVLMSVVYKIMAAIIAKKNYQGIGHYQCGFRVNRSTADHIFTLRMYFEKCYEYDVELHNLFIDFQQAYDSVNRNKLFLIMRNLGIPWKLVSLVKMTLENIKCRVKIQGELSQQFDVKSGVRQGDPLPTVLFNLVLEYAVTNITYNPGGTIFTTQHQLLAFADDICIVATNPRALTDAFNELEVVSTKIGLQINTSKTKYPLSFYTHHQTIQPFVFSFLPPKLPVLYYAVAP
jgi:sorting nexin-29